MAPAFVLFQGRLLGTAHIVTLAPPRPDGGKHIIEARVTGGVSYTESYHDANEAAGRYLALAAMLLGDPAIAEGIQPSSDDDENDDDEKDDDVASELPRVRSLPQRTALL